MSDVNVTPPEGQEPESPAEFELPDDPSAAFASIMDTIAPDEFASEAAEGGAEGTPPTAGDLAPASPGEGAGTADATAGAPAAGDGGSGAVGSGQEAEPTGFDATALTPKWGEITTALETKQQKELETESLEEVRTEFSKYFEAIQVAPRDLVGEEVPASNGKGMETLRDAADAREWQESIKKQLYKEVQDRASRKVEDVRPMMEQLHNTVALFRDNADVVPGSKQFDKELADAFATLAKPYEIRVNEKLSGWSIPVAGLLTQVREQLKTRRAAAAPSAAPAVPATPSAQQQRAAEQARNPQGQFHNDDAPQATITSKAGNSSVDATEDFSVLFGTLGLSNLKI